MPNYPKSLYTFAGKTVKLSDRDIEIIKRIAVGQHSKYLKTILGCHPLTVTRIRDKIVKQCGLAYDGTVSALLCLFAYELGLVKLNIAEWLKEYAEYERQVKSKG